MIKIRLSVFVLILQLSSIAQAITCSQSFIPGFAEKIRFFNAEKETVEISPTLNLPMVINGLKEKKSTLDPSNGKHTERPKPTIVNHEKKQVTIVGSGMAALTAALELTNRGYSVRMIEKKPKLGGLASGHQRAGGKYDNGTAYHSPLIPEQEPIYKQLGLKNYENTNPIGKKSDSLLVPGGVPQKDGTIKYHFVDFWEDPVVRAQLPASFELTFFVHKLMAREGRIPNQPFEKSGSPFVKIDYETFLHSQLSILKKYIKKNRNDKEAIAVLDRINEDIARGVLNPKMTKDNRGIMDPVIRWYLNNYGHSAMGGFPREINAALGLNFVVSEMEHRYTYPLGTGEVTRRILNILKKRKNLFEAITDAEVDKIVERKDGMTISYIKNGNRYISTSDRMIFAGPGSALPWIYHDLEKIAPKHYQILKSINEKNLMTDYLVTVLFIKVKDGKIPSVITDQYDNWIAQDKGEFSTEYPTDAIAGEWIEHKGYKIKHKKSDKTTTLALYQNLGRSRPMTRQELIRLGEKSIRFILDTYNPILKERGEDPLEIEFVELNFWDDSITIMEPGYTDRVDALMEPIGKYSLYRNSQQDTASHEGAMYRGWEGAVQLSKDFESSGIEPKVPPQEEE